MAAAIERLYGTAVSVTGRQPIGGGCIHQTFALELSNGGRVFYKQNRRALGPLFRAEAAGLLALRRALAEANTDGRLRVPTPLAIIEGQQQQGILLEYIASGRPDANYWNDLGHGLAAIHRSSHESSSGRFGFAGDNWLGATPQRNSWHNSWPHFFGHQRLLYQIELARSTGRADGALVRGVERIVARIDQLVPPPAQPSLLHGDLWSGNIMADDSGRPLLIDPAVYWGDREADIAMSTLFGGFDTAFYAAYAESWPLAAGSDQRRDLYNLYHLLNHLNLFGQSYLGSVQAIVAQYA